jgi:energy-coupling factor transporter ATP-binding protein EcfA2
MKTGFILLDEAFNGIDQVHKRSIISFLKNYLKDETIVLVTHNKDELELVDEIYELRNGILKLSTS